MALISAELALTTTIKGVQFSRVDYDKISKFYDSVGLTIRKGKSPKNFSYYLLGNNTLGVSGCVVERNVPSSKLRLISKGKVSLSNHPVNLLQDVYVNETVRGKGYGRQLIESLILHEGSENLWLKVAKDNDIAISLYESCGFKPVKADWSDDKIMVRLATPHSANLLKATSKADANKLKRNPEDWARKASIDDLADMVQSAKDAYYNSSKPLLDDEEYDTIEEILRERDPKNPALNIGARVRDKVRLPVSMGSLNKVKDEKALVQWEKKNPAKSYIIADKLDGVSFLIEGRADGSMKMYTRGDGKFGQDISTFIPSIKSIPKRKLPSGTLLRGELIMSKAKFENVWSKTAANARNMVSGLVNRKSLHKALANVDAVVYSRLDVPSMPEKQIKFAKKYGFKVVPWKRVEYLDFNELVEALDMRKSKSRFDLDGLVIQSDKRHQQADGNPSWAVAFKHNSESDMRIATVVKIDWRVSRYGKIKPRVEIEPLTLQGVTVTYAHSSQRQVHR